MQQYYDMRIALSGSYLGYFRKQMPAPLSRCFEYIANLSGYQYVTPQHHLQERYQIDYKQPQPEKPKEIDYEIVRNYLIDMVKMYN